MKMKGKIEKIFSVFEKRYRPIPLEIYKKDPYKTLISTILSSRTRDEVTLLASQRLFKIAPNIFILNKLSLEKIRKAIYPVGFYNLKAKNIKKTASIIVKEFKGVIPSKKKELLRLPGVGPKTANLVLIRAFGKNEISVDTHVHKIANILGLVKTKKPEKTEKELKKILPKKYWKRTNRLFVSIGRQFSSKKKLLEFLKKERLLKN